MIGEIKETEAGPDSARYIFMGMTHVAKKTDTEILYYGVNHLGATKLLTDETGEIVNELTDKTNPFGDQEEKGMFFTGKQWDEDARLYYFNARWYDPETGRFVTEDPIRSGMLWYAYASNNPMRFVDPTGLAKEDRLRRRAERAKEKGNDDRAAELSAEAAAIEQARQEQLERVKELPDGYSGINGLSKQGESNLYPETPGVDDLYDGELIDLYLFFNDNTSTISGLMSESPELFLKIQLATGTARDLGKAATLTSQGTGYLSIGLHTRNAIDDFENGDSIEGLREATSALTSAIGLVDPVAGIASNVMFNGVVDGVEALAEVNNYAKSDPISFISDYYSLFGKEFNPTTGY